MNYTYLLILFFLITSFEMGSFNVFFGPDIHNNVISLFFSIILSWHLLLAIKFKKIFNFGHLDSSEFKYFSTILLLLAIFHISHSFIVGPLSSMKYAAYLFILFILITQTQEKYFNRLGVIYFSFMSFVSIAAVVQILLISISGTSIYDFDTIKLVNSSFFRDVDYVQPYLLTFSSAEENVSFGPLSFIRAIGFSSEPKYFSVMLWSAYAISLNWNHSKYKKLLLFIRASLLIGIFFSHAYSSLLIILLAFLFYRLISMRFINNKIKAIIIVITPFLISIALTIFVNTILNLIPNDGAISSRMASFIYSTGGLDLTNATNFLLFGSNIVAQKDGGIGGSTMLLNLYRFGYVGFILYLTPIIFIIYKSILNFNYLEKKQRYGLALLLSIYIIYYQIFFSQPYTLLSCFILANIINTGIRQKIVRTLQQKSS